MERGLETGEQEAEVNIENISELGRQEIEDAIKCVTEFKVFGILNDHKLADFEDMAWDYVLLKKLADADSLTIGGTEHHTYYTGRIRNLYDAITSKPELASAFREECEQLGKIIEKHEAMLRETNDSFEIVSRYGYLGPRPKRTTGPCTYIPIDMIP